VVLFQKFENSNLPRSFNGFTCKPFYFNTQFDEEQKKFEGLLQEKKVMGKKLLDRCEVIFSELYITSMHLKILRVYIDGVLRFGIPPTFDISAIEPGQNERKVIKNLTDLYAKEEDKGLYGSKEEIQDTEDYYPFVIVPVSV